MEEYGMFTCGVIASLAKEVRVGQSSPERHINESSKAA